MVLFYIVIYNKILRLLNVILKFKLEIFSIDLNQFVR